MTYTPLPTDLATDAELAAVAADADAAASSAAAAAVSADAAVAAVAAVSAGTLPMSTPIIGDPAPPSVQTVLTVLINLIANAATLSALQLSLSTNPVTAPYVLPPVVGDPG